MAESCQTEDATAPCCCGPHVFTSVLLGVLACVLMTGGVFLAFHRWDPLWLIVSGIGVVLVLIGSILHCCRTRPPPPGGKGCCLPDHLHNHVVLNGGSLTEQLLPLSNARSVSQLSLNMLPGYFPPVVATYGIEQHSTVVQNINRIIQQQTQSPAAPGNPGKSFLLLSLPGNTPQANIQNLVATVYQLDGSVLAETSTVPDIPVPITTTSATTTTATVADPTQGSHPIRKNAEVQTCSVWSVPNPANTNIMMPSTSNAAQTTVIMSTQTDDPPLVAINLMDCSSDPICDNSTSMEVDSSTADALLQVSTEAMSSSNQQTPLIDIAQPSISTLLDIPSIPLAATNIPNTSSEVLIDISEGSTEHSSNSNNPRGTEHVSNNNNATEIDHLSNNTSSRELEHLPNNNNSREISETSTGSGLNHSTNSTVNSSVAVFTETTSNSNAEQNATTSSNDLAVPSTSASSDSQNSSEDNSLCVIDVDDIESLGRSSPPPSYEDVALQSETPPGAFGMNYGTL